MPPASLTKRLTGRPRRTLAAAVRARHQPCRLCGYPIDQRPEARQTPLGSAVDEWYPRALGGNPLDPTNCVELHALCNGMKGATWPITADLATRCRTRIETILNPSGTPTIHPW